ncbi:hypothetical protein TNCV_3426151 [Trichonephila clavipes]|nr:hypothetical protein TNCV_3426151 [Trichonephila clavipes]
MVLKANDRRTSCPCHDEFRGPRSDYVRQQNRIPTRRARYCDYLYLQITGIFICNSTLNNGHVQPNSKALALKTSHASACNTTMIGVWRHLGEIA